MSRALTNGIKALLPAGSRVVIVGSGEFDIRGAIKHAATVELLRDVGGIVTTLCSAKSCGDDDIKTGRVAVVVGMEEILDLPLDRGAKIVVLFARGDDLAVVASAAERVAEAWGAGHEIDLSLVARDQGGLAELQDHFPRARVVSLPDPTLALAGALTPHQTRGAAAGVIFRHRDDASLDGKEKKETKEARRGRVWHVPTVLEGEGIYLEEGTRSSSWAGFGLQNEKSETIFRALGPGDRAAVLLELAVTDLSRAKLVVTDSVVVGSLCLVLGIDHVAIVGRQGEATGMIMRTYLGSWNEVLRGGQGQDRRKSGSLSQRQQLAVRGFAVAKDWNSVDADVLM